MEVVSSIHQPWSWQAADAIPKGGTEDDLIGGLLTELQGWLRVPPRVVRQVGADNKGELVSIPRH